MEGKQHGDVVSAIKAGGDETKLLVVDKETDEFFKKCKVTPSQEHLTGELSGVAGGLQVRAVGQRSRLDCVPGEGWAASCFDAPLCPPEEAQACVLGEGEALCRERARLAVGF